MANTSGRGTGRPGLDLSKFGNPLTIVIIGVGLLIIAIGANGIRSNGTVVQQMPYLLTGGVVGLAFVVFGCAYLVVQSARQDRAALESKLDKLIEAIEAATDGSPRGAAPGDVSGLVVAGTASYHVPGCRLVDGREEVSYLTPAEAEERQLKPCRVCNPERADHTEVTVR